jgi:hypothetical protein
MTRSAENPVFVALRREVKETVMISAIQRK